MRQNCHHLFFSSSFPLITSHINKFIIYYNIILTSKKNNFLFLKCLLVSIIMPFYFNVVLFSSSSLFYSSFLFIYLFHTYTGNVYIYKCT